MPYSDKFVSFLHFYCIFLICCCSLLSAAIPPDESVCKITFIFLFCILHLTLRVFFEALFLSVHFKLSSSITQNRVFEYSFFYFWLHHFCSFLPWRMGCLLCRRSACRVFSARRGLSADRYSRPCRPMPISAFLLQGPIRLLAYCPTRRL